MKVYKFGGASINGAERFRNTANIIGGASPEKLMVVVSAMGKTTNALEEVAESYFSGDKEKAIASFAVIKDLHLNTLRELAPSATEEGRKQLLDIFTEVEWLLHEKPVRGFDYYYDQIVCAGELMSSIILYRLLRTNGISCRWADARDIINTDNNFREGYVNREATAARVKDLLIPLFKESDTIITQGFIGSTDENESTTLGREGSDYTAALMAQMLEAVSLTIWKDVDAVMNADPRLFPDAVKLTSLSYLEVIEMAYYGAQVIHPKTIKPLQNNNIPLFVKSFIHPDLPGTVISQSSGGKLPPIIVIKNNQVLIRFGTKDFSFVEDKPVESLQEIFRKVRVKPNLTQKTAISLLCCFDDRPDKTDQLAGEASDLFDIHLERGLTLLTVRHYDEETLKKLTLGRNIVLEQKTAETVQVLMSELT